MTRVNPGHLKPLTVPVVLTPMEAWTVAMMASGSAILSAWSSAERRAVDSGIRKLEHAGRTYEGGYV